MKTIYHRISLSLFFIFSVLSCSPSIGPTLSLPNLISPAHDRLELSQPKYDGYVFIDQFTDNRSSKALADVDGRDVQPKEEVAPAVLLGVKDALYRKGFKFSDTAPVVLSGEVREWFARVQGGLSHKVDAQAAIYVEVLDPANKRIYSGVYKGSASREGAGLDEKELRKTLGTSMTEAIKQVMSDQQLLKLISSF